MLGQVISNVLKSPQRRPLLARPTRFDDDDLGCMLQKRYRITYGPSGLTSVFPTDDNTLSSQRTYAVRHHQRRTSEFQNGFARIEGSVCTAPSLIVSDHHEIGIPRFTD